MDGGRSLYEILQVDRRAEPEVVEAAYRRLARKYHPDTSGIDDGGKRMKELNAAYEVLRDPARRAAYDRQLPPHAGPPAASPVTSRPQPAPVPDTGMRRPPAGVRFGCRQHPATVAVGRCSGCGAGLCAACFDRFSPSSCPSCALAWAERRQRELLMPALWFFIMLGATLSLLLRYHGELFRPRPALAATIEVVASYLVASFPSGWHVARSLDRREGELFFPLLLALFVGPIVAPFRIVRILIELRQVRRVRALARAGG